MLNPEQETNDITAWLQNSETKPLTARRKKERGVAIVVRAGRKTAGRNCIIITVAYIKRSWIIRHLSWSLGAIEPLELIFEAMEEMMSSRKMLPQSLTY